MTYSVDKLLPWLSLAGDLFVVYGWRVSPRLLWKYSPASDYASPHWLAAKTSLNLCLLNTLQVLLSLVSFCPVIFKTSEV